jgi:hypothetical protein
MYRNIIFVLLYHRHKILYLTRNYCQNNLNISRRLTTSPLFCNMKRCNLGDSSQSSTLMEPVDSFETLVTTSIYRLHIPENSNLNFIIFSSHHLLLIGISFTLAAGFTGKFQDCLQCHLSLISVVSETMRNIEVIWGKPNPTDLRFSWCIWRTRYSGSYRNVGRRNFEFRRNISPPSSEWKTKLSKK